ncbi:hypothetical protein [Arthrobacter sp. UYCu712]|uniref:hypothetical protein n=1 Tax=Arthrobacter sp. UYCu712 TaxID=3156340 RepID=UPI003394F4F0
MTLGVDDCDGLGDPTDGESLGAGPPPVQAVTDISNAAARAAARIRVLLENKVRDVMVSYSPIENQDA